MVLTKNVGSFRFQIFSEANVAGVITNVFKVAQKSNFAEAGRKFNSDLLRVEVVPMISKPIVLKTSWILWSNYGLNKSCQGLIWTS